jgi:P27 family predicted phage terminase small subunit
MPAKPSWLCAEASTEWDFIGPHLVSLGVLSVGDGSALAGYCQSFGRWIQAERIIDAEGPVIDEPTQTEGVFRKKKHPACNVANENKAAMRAFLTLFGLDPSSRTRLKVNDPSKEKDPFEEYMNRKRRTDPASDEPVN